MSYVLPKPRKLEDNWILFDNVTFPPFKHPRGCSDTIESRCYRGDTLNECIERCKKAGEDSGVGYFLKAPGKPSYCLPLRTASFKELNPVYELRNKNEFDNTDNISTYTFLNTKMFPYPPDDANNVFFGDKLILHNAERDLNADTTSLASPFIQFNKKGDKVLKIIRREADDRSVFVNYGDEFVLSIPESNAVLAVNPELKWLSWVSQRTKTMGPENVFTLVPTDKKKAGKRVNYNDAFYIIQNYINYVALNQNNQLEIYWDAKDKMISKGRGIVFKFIPKITSYYCDNGICKSIELVKTKRDGQRARYLDKIVFRDEYCFGICKQEEPAHEKETVEKNQENQIPGIVKYSISGISVAILLVIFITMVVYILRKRKSK